MAVTSEQSAGGPMLVVLNGPDQGKMLRLTPGIWRIGRGRQNDLKLRDTEVSRQHAQIRVTEDEILLEDLGSSNGTYVNGVRVSSYPLQAGDRIQLGRTTLVVNSGPLSSTSSPQHAEVRIVPGPSDLDASAIVPGIPPADSLPLFRRPDLEEADLRSALASLGVLYEVSKAVSHIGDIPDLLDRILRLVLESVPAEQAVIFLLEDGELRPYAARTEKARPDSSIRVSRTIVDYVLEHNEGVLTMDARQDERFAGGASVQQFAIRQAICVPMQGRHDLVGVLYLDRKADPFADADQPPDRQHFTEHHLLLALAIARIAALAVEDTRYHQALLRAERLAAIGQAMAALSHHIKNILQGFRTGEAVLELGLKQNNASLIQQGWNAIKRSQDRIFHLVMDMLSYSKERTPLWEEVDVNELVREVVDSARARADEVGARLAYEPASPPVRCYLDQQAIHQVLLNLVLNALDAIEGQQGGTVRIRVAPSPDTNTVSFIVSDTGPGIPPELQRHIFSPFFSTKGSRGTGLGLAVSEKIVREHDGEILLTSEPGKGSVFEVRLPLHREPPDGDGQADLSGSEVSPPTLVRPLSEPPASNVHRDHTSTHDSSKHGS